MATQKYWDGTLQQWVEVGGAGALIDVRREKYFPKMKASFTPQGVSTDIRNKPPTGASAPYLYDADTDSVFYVANKTIGKLSMSTGEISVAIAPNEHINILTFPGLSAKRVESIIQIYGDTVYSYVSGNVNSQQYANNIQKIFAFNKHTLEFIRVYDVKAIIDSNNAHFYGIQAIFVTENDIVFNTVMNINNSSYAVNMFTISKSTGLLRGKTDLNTVNVPNWCGLLYRIDDHIYTLAGDGANVRVVKVSYNPTSGVLTKIGYTSNTLPLGPNGMEYHQMFHEGNLLYVGPKWGVVNIDTLAVVSSQTSFLPALQWNGNILYVRNGNSIQEYNLSTGVMFTVEDIGVKLEYAIPGYLSIISNREFKITDYLLHISALGPSFMEYIYNIEFYKKESDIR